MTTPLRNVLLLDDLRVHICPKVGSTALQNALAPWRYKHVAPEEPGPELRFMAVRHPLERIVSAWRYFCCASEPEQAKRLSGAMADLGYRPSMPFSAFLALCLETHAHNRHTRRQVDFAGPHRIDVLVPLHCLNEAWEGLRHRLPWLPALAHVNRTEHAPWEHYFTDDQRQRALAVFAEDLALFHQALTRAPVTQAA